MRVRPVASTGVTRIAKRDMQLGRYLVPAGTTIIVPFDAVHHFQGNWAQPDDFLPVRALPCSLFCMTPVNLCPCVLP